MKKIVKEKGITLIALVITIIVLLILAGIGISMLSGENGILKKAGETVVVSDYQFVKTELDLYKMNDAVETTGKKFNNEDLLGVVAKKVIVKDTTRELAVLVDFDTFNSEPTYGKGGTKLLEESNNDKNTIKEVETLSDLKDVYVIDLHDGLLYYINGEKIYTLETEKIQIEENGITLEKYPIETNGPKHANRKRFITKWDVTLGETEGSETYSTVVLPVNNGATYDATIYWGDGTSTILQHKTNGITLTDAQLIEKLTHNYELGENDNTEKTIEIDGTYTSFNVGYSANKLKLIRIEQWGNTGLTSIFFQGCSNLSGIIPKNDLIELNCQGYCFANTKITGFEEGFCFSGGSFVQAFRDCKYLKTLPNSFKIPEGSSLADAFRGCSGLENLPDNFVIPDSVTSLYETFYQCSSLKKIPDGFKVPKATTSVVSLFAGCSSLEKIPSDFSLHEGITGVANLFSGCGKLTEIPEVFTIPEGVTSIQGTFMGLGIKRLPSNFKIPYGVTNMINAFNWCAIEEFPENFEIPETVTNMYNAFRGCQRLKGTITIKANPTDYSSCFANQTAGYSGEKLIVNYSKNCTNIDNIIATRSGTYVVKGEQID